MLHRPTRSGLNDMEVMPFKYFNATDSRKISPLGDLVNRGWNSLPANYDTFKSLATFKSYIVNSVSLTHSHRLIFSTAAASLRSFYVLVFVFR